MASEEQLNNQKKFNSSLEEAQEFIGLLVSRTSDLVDTFRRLNNRSKDVTRDQSETLKILKSINTSARNLTSEYSSMKDVTNAIKEAKKNQIKLDNTLLSLGQKLTEDSKERVKKYTEGQQRIISLEEEYKDKAKEAGQERVDKANELFSLEKDLLKNREKLSSLEEEEGFNKKLFEEKKNKEKALADSRKEALDAYTIALKGTDKEAITAAKELYEAQNTLYKGHMDSYSLSEKEYDIALKTVKEKQKEYEIQLGKSDSITKDLETS